MGGSYRRRSMPDNYLSKVKDGMEELEKAFTPADKQSDAREGAIDTINKMCDALQLACDKISEQISGTLLEFDELLTEKDAGELQTFFRRTARRFSHESLSLLLHD